MGIRIGEITKSEIQYVQAVINLDSGKMSDVRAGTTKNPVRLTIPRPPADESSISSSQPGNNISPNPLQTAEKSSNKITESSNKSQVSNMQAPKYNDEGDEISDDGTVIKSASAVALEKEYVAREIEVKSRDRTEAEIIREFERSKPIGKHQMSAKARQLCGMTREQADQIVPVKRFYDLQSRRVEPLSDWRGRQLLWDWMEKCLKGNKEGRKGRWHYLVDSSVTPTYDCQKLFCSIVKEVEIPNLKSHGELMENF